MYTSISGIAQAYFRILIFFIFKIVCEWCYRYVFFVKKTIAWSKLIFETCFVASSATDF